MRRKTLVDYCGVRAGTTIMVPEHMRERYVAIGLIAPDETDPSDEMTVEELKEELKKLKLPVSGRKNELLKRLRAAGEEE